jgi:hypothetical protein
VTNVACRGATTDWIFKTGQPAEPKGIPSPQIAAVSSADNLIFLTLGGDNVNFSGLVEY